LGFGEIIQPSLRPEELDLPAITGKVVIAAFEKANLKFGKPEDFDKIEAVECDCELYIDEIIIDGRRQLQPQIRYSVAQKAKQPINLYWLMKQVVPSAASSCASFGGGAAREPVAMCEALRPCNSFGMHLKLEHGDLLMKFDCDSEVAKWERAVKHVYGYFHSFTGRAYKLNEFAFSEEQKLLCVRLIFVLFFNHVSHFLISCTAGIFELSVALQQ
jgi:hypothetical protein